MLCSISPEIEQAPETNQSLNIFSETLQYPQILSSKKYIYSALSGQTDDLLWHYFKFPVGLLVGSRRYNIVTYKDSSAHCPEDIYTVTPCCSHGQHWKMKKELTFKSRPLSYVCTAGQSAYKAIRSPHTLLQWQSTCCRRHTVFQPHQQLLPLSSLKH